MTGLCKATGTTSRPLTRINPSEVTVKYRVQLDVKCYSVDDDDDDVDKLVDLRPRFHWGSSALAARIRFPVVPNKRKTVFYWVAERSFHTYYHDHTIPSHLIKLRCFTVCIDL